MMENYLRQLLALSSSQCADVCVCVLGVNERDAKSRHHEMFNPSDMSL